MYPEKKGGSHKMARPQQNWGLLTLLTRWASIWTMPNAASPKSEPPYGESHHFRPPTTEDCPREAIQHKILKKKNQETSPIQCQRKPNLGLICIKKSCKSCLRMLKILEHNLFIYLWAPYYCALFHQILDRYLKWLYNYNSNVAPQTWSITTMENVHGKPKNLLSRAVLTTTCFIVSCIIPPHFRQISFHHILDRYPSKVIVATSFFSMPFMESWKVLRKT